MGVDAAALRRVFERAPVLADRLTAEAPFPSADAALARARSLLGAMTEPERVAVLDAHPRIGTDPRALSAESRREQGADADGATSAELAALNDEYERRFGFRFVVFVAGRSKAEIVPVLRRRLGRARDEELATGIGEVLAIAEDRLRR